MLQNIHIHLRSIYTCFFLFLAVGLSSQETVVYEYPYWEMEQAQEMYNHRLLGLVEIINDDNIATPFFQNDLKKQQAEFLTARAELMLDLDNADLNLETLVKKYKISNNSLALSPELALHHFQKGEFKTALKYFEAFDATNSSLQSTEEYYFKKGYCLFVQRNFAQALPNFSKGLQTPKDYKTDNIYYQGVSQYFLKDFDKARRNFEKLKTAPIYEAYIPYYLTQIYFSDGDHIELVEYGNQVLRKDKTKNKNRIHLLLGQSYYKNKDFEKALYHLEAYEGSTKKLKAIEFFQLAYTQYQLKKYEKAQSNFSEINTLNDSLGQYANYYLADCYIKGNDKTSARTAFKKVSAMSFNKVMQEEAKFNYGKLSMELGFDAEAISILSSTAESSSFYKNAQELLATLFLNTSDYDRSLNAIDRLPNKSNQLKEVYQKLAYRSATQSYLDKKYNQSIQKFDRALKYDNDKNLKAESLFWKAIAQSNTSVNATSDATLNQYLTYSKENNVSKKENYKAHYYLAYSALRKENKADALKQFELCLNNSNVSSDQDLVEDAQLRAGDCNFALNRYQEASSYYGVLSQKENKNAAYAKYQSAMIKGLENAPYEKIILLEELYKSDPTGEFADQALMQMGNTYTQLGKNAEAFEAYQDLIVVFQGSSPLVNQALLKLGLSSYNQGDASTALKFYKKVMNNNPTSKESDEAILAIEEIYIQDLNSSKDFLDYVSNLPDYDVSESEKDSLNFRIAQIQFENAEYSKAATSFENYLEGNEKGRYKLEAQFSLAQCYTFSKNYLKALKYYDQVVLKGQSKHYKEALSNGAIIAFNEAKDYPKAYDYNTKLYTLLKDPDKKKKAQLAIMQSAYKSENFAEASKHAIEIFNDESTELSDKVTASFVIGKNALALDDEAQAISSLNFVIRNSSAGLAAESSFLLSELYFKNGKLEESEQQCKSTNTVSSNYPYWIAKSLLLLSEIYMAKDDLYNARAATEAVLENFKDDPEILKSAEQKLEQIKIREDVQSRILNETDSIPDQN